MADEPWTAVRLRDSWKDAVLSWRLWWQHSVTASVDQTEVISARREEAMMSARYLFMLAMSAGIAMLGLLLSSPAVVIGAMLLSPLMGPIIGLGFALATGDYLWLRKSLRALVLGSLLSIAFCALIVALSPLQTVTPEIAARTRPNLFDLGVALFSALAGAYAMIRGREGAIVGVAIATALMPPLAVVGFGVATWNWTVFSGASVLYLTNLVTIALTAMVMAKLYGFRVGQGGKNETRLQGMIVVAAFIVLIVPLGLSLRQIAWEANSQRLVNGAILKFFPEQARISEINVDFKAEPILISATVLTPDLKDGAQATANRYLTDLMGTTVRLDLEQFLVGTTASAAEAAEIAGAQARRRAGADQQVRDLTERMALIAGVSEEEILIDRERRRATVRVEPLPGAGLATYRALERRIAVRVPDWSIMLDPPARPLPEVTFADGAPTQQGLAALGLVAWAGRRIDAPVLLTGPDALTALAQERLSALGVRTLTQSGPEDSIVEVTWASPDADAAMVDEFQ
ncbi:DUF389 domain-containing protein [Croceicoccus sp. F390]|uniref:DUF389 domain-containing protein n=1 Tax=Croceicoccus esteveae TaxID=3075597 RepID=A0ABU2ZJN5_9SPHN|nr:DUF389 domain-containing protein [Croceicoccus sp. F390]MDT0576817.1 DUF389 domain-containing protein [Croceicoccus sp. F390]